MSYKPWDWGVRHEKVRRSFRGQRHFAVQSFSFGLVSMVFRRWCMCGACSRILWLPLKSAQVAQADVLFLFAAVTRHGIA